MNYIIKNKKVVYKYNCLVTKNKIIITKKIVKNKTV
jgi:hypothetical protein